MKELLEGNRPGGCCRGVGDPDREMVKHPERWLNLGEIEGIDSLGLGDGLSMRVKDNKASRKTDCWIWGPKF